MSSESMERKKAHYLRDIIREEELMKYASKAGVTSFQKSVAFQNYSDNDMDMLQHARDMLENRLIQENYNGLSV